jgi:hypothetical protein
MRKAGLDRRSNCRVQLASVIKKDMLLKINEMSAAADNRSRG